MAVVVAAAGMTMAGADNNQQKAAAGAAKTADMAAVGAEVALAATAAAAAAAEAVAVAAAETAAMVAIAMAMAEGKTRGRGDRRMGLGVPPDMKNKFRVPCIQLGNYLAQIRAMFLANTYLHLSQCLAHRKSFICAADRFICLHR
jgi:hypothetical protein